MKKLVLLRHGESLWNKENRFTGWTDVDLTDKGIHEAHEAAQSLQAQNLGFDVAFTSVLKRAIRTLWIVLDDMDLMWIPVYRSWRLNERHYGALQGLNKAETAGQYGMKQVQMWRRGYATPPPPLDPADARNPRRDPRYASLAPAEVPLGESLRETVERFLPCWRKSIAPEVASGKRVLIAAHGNSLRALVKYLDHVGDDEIAELNIPTGVPLVYELNDDMVALRRYYLGDPEKVQEAAKAVAGQLEDK